MSNRDLGIMVPLNRGRDLLKRESLQDVTERARAGLGIPDGVGIPLDPKVVDPRKLRFYMDRLGREDGQRLIHLAQRAAALRGGQARKLTTAFSHVLAAPTPHERDRALSDLEVKVAAFETANAAEAARELERAQRRQGKQQDKAPDPRLETRIAGVAERLRTLGVADEVATTALRALSRDTAACERLAHLHDEGTRLLERAIAAGATDAVTALRGLLGTRGLVRRQQLFEIERGLSALEQTRAPSSPAIDVERTVARLRARIEALPATRGPGHLLARLETLASLSPRELRRAVHALEQEIDGPARKSR